jgi:hypothetical protein
MDFNKYMYDGKLRTMRIGSFVQKMCDALGPRPIGDLKNIDTTIVELKGNDSESSCAICYSRLLRTAKIRDRVFKHTPAVFRDSTWCEYHCSLRSSFKSITSRSYSTGFVPLVWTTNSLWLRILVNGAV